MAFAREIAMHIAASPSTQYVSEEDIPQDAKDAELRVFEQQAADKPEHIRPKIAEGKLKAWMNDVVLLNQLARQRGQVRGQDDRGAARDPLRHDGRERRDPALRPLRGGGVTPDPVFKRVLIKLSGEALMGPLDYGTDPRPSARSPTS